MRLIYFYVLSRSCFSGSLGSFNLLTSSFLGDSLRLCDRDDEMITYPSCWSWVGGNSSSRSFLLFFVAVANFLTDSAGNASLLS